MRLMRFFDVAARKSDRIRRERMWRALFMDCPPAWALDELRAETEHANARESRVRSFAHGGVALAVALVALMIVLALAGCSVSGEVKDAAARASDSAAKLREAFDKVKQELPANVAAVTSLKAILTERLDAHEQLLDTLKEATGK